MSEDGPFGIVAKARYTRKRKITEVVPEDVTRARAAAWLDLISPVTEWAGLKGDQLRNRREQLRLQREDTLYAVVSKWKERSNSRLSSNEIPLKFIVPFLEKASLEDPATVLVDLWANLLWETPNNVGVGDGSAVEA